jgi:hypothetical protein
LNAKKSMQIPKTKKPSPSANLPILHEVLVLLHYSGAKMAFNARNYSLTQSREKKLIMKT